MNKQIVITLGDKGGVGKSIYAMLVVDYALNCGQPTVLVEGDNNIGDVAARFRGVAGVTTLSVNLDTSGADAENAVNKLYSEIETTDDDFIVLNTPANASKALDLHADLIAAVSAELGYSVRVAWLLGPAAESAILANKSAMAAVADKRIAVINRGLTASAGDDHYAWLASHSADRQRWLENSGAEGELPLLLNRVAGPVKNMPGRFTELAQPGSQLNVISRSSLWRWLQSSWLSGVKPLVED